MTLHLPHDWMAALSPLRTARRVLVLGATDMGKSSFIRALAESRGERTRIVDLDPGQKIVGPPGTASLGSMDELERFIFLGSTSVGSFNQLAQAGAALAAGAEPFVVNTSGYVQGPGARLQAMTLAALAPDAVVAIGPAPSLEPLLAGSSALRLERSPEARRKTPSERTRSRQAAFAQTLFGAEHLSLPSACWEPGKPREWTNAERPVCALADERGQDMCIGVVEAWREEALTIWAKPPPHMVRVVRLGRMWAAPGSTGWLLLERLSPAWSEG